MKHNYTNNIRLIKSKQWKLAYYTPREGKTWPAHSSCELTPEPKPWCVYYFSLYPGRKHHIPVSEQRGNVALLARVWRNQHIMHLGRTKFGQSISRVNCHPSRRRGWQTRAIFPHIETENTTFPFRIRKGMWHFRPGYGENRIMFC